MQLFLKLLRWLQSVQALYSTPHHIRFPSIQFSPCNLFDYIVTCWLYCISCSQQCFCCCCFFSSSVVIVVSVRVSSFVQTWYYYFILKPHSASYLCVSIFRREYNVLFLCFTFVPRFGVCLQPLFCLWLALVCILRSFFYSTSMWIWSERMAMLLDFNFVCLYDWKLSLCICVHRVSTIYSHSRCCCLSVYITRYP